MIKLTPTDQTFDLAPLTLYRAWELPTPGHVTFLQHEGSTTTMGLIGDPRKPTPHFAEPDRIGLLNVATGELRIVSDVQRGTVTAAWIAGTWLIRRETVSHSTGCGANTTDCQSWRLYEQPLDLSSGPRQIAASIRPGPTLDEPVPASDGSTLVWQSLGLDGATDTFASNLGNPQKMRILAKTSGPASQLTIDGSDNVLIDSPTSNGHTELLSVNITNGKQTELGMYDAHYLRVRGSKLLDVTGTGGRLTEAQASTYRPGMPPGTTDTRTIFRTGDLYDVQFLDETSAVAIDSEGVAIIDLTAGTVARVRARPIFRGAVTAGDGHLTMLLSTPSGGEAIVDSAFTRPTA